MASAATELSVCDQVRGQTRRRQPPPYHVILLDDDFHTYEYVIRMLVKVFRYSEARAYQAACTVDEVGRVILLTTSKEVAELKQEQIHTFGPDRGLRESRGSMSAVIEPAE